MNINKVLRATSPVAMAILVASCGGGSGDSASSGDTEPVAAAGNALTNPVPASQEQTATPDTGTVLSGRVADGYIQGATVCIDLNESDSCDDDEPSALTGVGGSYDLAVPVGAEDKPIVADIPAEAIDEDTGEAVGQSLVFIAPADQPEFISPITTLVHQELKSNPSLNTEDAEDAVKSLLGINEEDVSLFEDYVAGGEEEGGSTERKDNFRYLHDTARVVASMMKDIEFEVESAAQSNGIDVVGSKDTQRAIRDIVRREVRQLLPEIAQQVATIVRTDESANAVTGVGADVDAEASAEFDPDRIALSLRPEAVTVNVQERIDAVVERVDSVRADLKQLLTEGIYWFEFDCMYKEYAGQPGPDAPSGEGSSSGSAVSAPATDVESEFEKFDADADSDERFDSLVARYCSPTYGKVQLNATGDELVSQSYDFDPLVGAWSEYIDESEESSDFALIDGEWKETSSSNSGPQGKVVFADDGSAVVSTPDGQMQLKAVTRNLGASEVKKHLLSDVSDPAWFELVDSSDFFPAGSQAHLVSVKQTLHPYMLFNEKPYGDYDERSCAEYGDNCNVVGVPSNDQFIAMQTLDEVRKAAVEGVGLMSKHSGIGYGAIMTLKNDGESDGTVPTSGSVVWSFGHETHGETPGAPGAAYPEGEYYTPEGEYYIDECYAPGMVYGEIDETTPVEIRVPSEVEPLQVDVPVAAPETGDGNGDFVEGSDPVETSVTAEGSVDDLPDGSTEKFDEYNCEYVVEESDVYRDTVETAIKPMVDGPSNLSRWKMVEVDGVQMIEIQVPDMFRFYDDNSEQAILLAEHEGFVRQGMRMVDSFIDRVATYNESAFTALKAIVESGATDKK